MTYENVPVTELIKMARDVKQSRVALDAQQREVISAVTDRLQFYHELIEKLKKHMMTEPLQDEPTISPEEAAEMWKRLQQPVTLSSPGFISTTNSSPLGEPYTVTTTHE